MPLKSFYNPKFSFPSPRLLLQSKISFSIPQIAFSIQDLLLYLLGHILQPNVHFPVTLDSFYNPRSRFLSPRLLFQFRISFSTSLAIIYNQMCPFPSLQNPFTIQDPVIHPPDSFFDSKFSFLSP